MNEVIRMTFSSPPKTTIKLNGETALHNKLNNLDFKNSGHTGFQAELSEEQIENINNIKNNQTEINELKSENEILKKRDKLLENYGAVEITPTNPDYFDFTLSDDGTYYTITGFVKDKTLTKAVIPYEYNDLPVAAIGEKAFWTNKFITSVIIPKSVTLIGAQAFYYCELLSDISIPDSVTVINHSAFYGCYSLDTITFPKDITVISESLFYDCRIKRIIIPDGVTTIENKAFGHCPELTSVIIPESVTSIGNDVFRAPQNAELKIQCEYGSAAHTYAIENNIKHSLNSGVFVNEFGGEIFNDIEKNCAYGKNSHAEGFNTQSGHKGYKMLSIEQNSKNDKWIDITVDDKVLAEKAENYYKSGDLLLFEGDDHLVDKLTVVSTSFKLNGNSVIIARIDDSNLSFEDFKLVTPDENSENWLCVAKKDCGQNILQYHSNHSEGEGTFAIGRSSHAEGRGSIAKGNHSHAEGRETEAGYASHSEGYGAKALGKFSHAQNHNTKALGQSSHAEGAATEANGLISHAEGQGSIANGQASHAEGLHTRAYSNNQHTEGKYNIIDTQNKYLHIAGNGDSDKTRSNAYTLDWDGNSWHQGTVEASGIILRSSTPQSNKKFLLTVDDDGVIETTLI